MQQVRELIERKLRAPDIAAEDICCALQLSRTYLYRLFKPYGGVKKYIQSRRLQHIHTALADPAERRPIMAIAEDFGFTNQAHFSRAFHRHFGYRPSEVRCDPAAALRLRAAVTQDGPRDGLRPGHGTPGAGPGFDDWVRALRSA